jgi:hypothetical protein
MDNDRTTNDDFHRMSLTQTRSPPVASKKPNRTRPLAVSARNRAATSNGSTILDGVDGRSAEARRFRDLVMAFAADLGADVTDLSEADAALCRHAASATMQSEALSRAVVNGEHVDTEQAVRAGNLLTRAMAALQRRRKPRSTTTPSIHDIAARHRNGGAGA